MQMQNRCHIIKDYYFIYLGPEGLMINVFRAPAIKLKTARRTTYMLKMSSREINLTYASINAS